MRISSTSEIAGVAPFDWKVAAFNALSPPLVTALFIFARHFKISRASAIAIVPFPSTSPQEYTGTVTEAAVGVNMVASIDASIAVVSKTDMIFLFMVNEFLLLNK